MMTKVLERLSVCPHSTIIFRNIDRFVDIVGVVVVVVVVGVCVLWVLWML